MCENQKYVSPAIHSSPVHSVYTFHEKKCTSVESDFLVAVFTENYKLS